MSGSLGIEDSSLEDSESDGEEGSNADSTMKDDSALSSYSDSLAAEGSTTAEMRQLLREYEQASPAHRRCALQEILLPAGLLSLLSWVGSALTFNSLGLKATPRR